MAMNDTPSLTSMTLAAHSPHLQPQRPQPTPPLPPLSDRVEQPCHSPSCSLEEEIKRLDDEYIDIESLVLETITKYNISHKTMLRWVQVMPLEIKTQFSQMVVAQAKTLSNASNADELFIILSHYWNSQHPNLLKYLIRKLGDDILNERIEHYMEQLRRFRVRTTLGNFIDKWMLGPPPGFDKYVIKLGERWRDKTLEDLNQFVIGLSRQKCFECNLLYMNKVTTGCLAVVIAFPQCCFPLRPDDELLHYLQENMVHCISTEDECILNLEPNKSDHVTNQSSNKIHTESTIEKGNGITFDVPHLRFHLRDG